MFGKRLLMLCVVVAGFSVAIALRGLPKETPQVNQSNDEPEPEQRAARVNRVPSFVSNPGIAGEEVQKDRSPPGQSDTPNPHVDPEFMAELSRRVELARTSVRTPADLPSLLAAARGARSRRGADIVLNPPGNGSA